MNLGFIGLAAVYCKTLLRMICQYAVMLSHIPQYAIAIKEHFKYYLLLS